MSKPATIAILTNARVVDKRSMIGCVSSCSTPPGRAALG